LELLLFHNKAYYGIQGRLEVHTYAILSFYRWKKEIEKTRGRERELVPLVAFAPILVFLHWPFHTLHSLNGVDLVGVLNL